MKSINNKIRYPYLICLLLLIACKTPYSQKSEITNRDTLFTESGKVVKVRDFYDKIYLEKHYNLNDEIDSIFYIDNCLSRERVFSNIEVSSRAKPLNEKALKKFVSENLLWPSKFDGTGIIIISFIVEANGKITNCRVITGLEACEECNENAMKITKLFPHWIPASNNGINVPVYEYYPIRYFVSIPPN